MTKLGLTHILVGFWLIFIASCGGFFLADHRLESFLRGRPDELLSWWMVLQSSAHGHTNLFGMLHILSGLTLPYSSLNPPLKALQFISLLAGSLAMSALLVARSFHMPTHLADPLGVLIGLLLSCSLISIVLHISGLSIKWWQS